MDEQQPQQRRLTLFLYTDKEAIDDATKAAMIDAGYLPVLVKNLSNYRIIEHSVRLSGDRLDAIGQAAISALARCGYGSAKSLFTDELSILLGACSRPKS